MVNTVKFDLISAVREKESVSKSLMPGITPTSDFKNILDMHMKEQLPPLRDNDKTGDFNSSKNEISVIKQERPAETVEVKADNKQEEKPSSKKSDDAEKTDEACYSGINQKPVDKNENQKTTDSQDNEKLAVNEKPAEDIKTSISRLKALLSLLNGLAVNQKDLSDLKSSIREIHDFFSEKNEKNKSNAKVLDGLFKKLEQVLRNIDKGKLTERGTLKTGITSLSDTKKQIESLIEVLSKYAKRSVKDTVSENEIKDLRDIKSFSEKTLFNNDSIKSARSDNSGADNQGLNGGMNNFKGFQNLMKSANAPADMPKARLFNEQMQDIMQNARIFVRDGKNGSFSVNLYPESLGKVNINLGLEHGILTGKFLVENDDAKQILLDNIAALKEQLEGAGISVGDFHVNVRDESEKYFSGTKTAAGQVISEFNGEASDEYELNSVYHHNGSIDLVI
jgi:flagellar hook-length control protein FliK